MKLFISGIFTCALLFAGVLLNGCSSPSDELLGVDNSMPHAVTGSSSPGNPSIADVARFRVGETVIVSFSGPPTPIDSHQEIIKEDGTINLDNIGKIYAVGKTAGELQNEIHDAYVPKYFVRLTVNVSVKSEDRIVTVAGEVHSPGRVVYLPDATVIKIIQAAGGLTDFANHSKVWLTHSGSSKRIQVNYDKAVKDPALDPPVYPDDQIYVNKSW